MFCDEDVSGIRSCWRVPQRSRRLAIVCDWLLYVERLEHFFKANKMEGKQWLSVFLSTIGVPTHKVLKSLVASKKPGDKDLGTLTEALQRYFNPKSSQMMQRFKFHSRKRLPGESITEYVTHLCSLSANCEFGTFLDDMLWDCLVCGIEDSSIQKRLLS